MIRTAISPGSLPNPQSGLRQGQSGPQSFPLSMLRHCAELLQILDSFLCGACRRRALFLCSFYAYHRSPMLIETSPKGYVYMLRPAVPEWTAGPHIAEKPMVPCLDQQGGFVKGAEKAPLWRCSAAEAGSDKSVFFQFGLTLPPLKWRECLLRII